MRATRLTVPRSLLAMPRLVARRMAASSSVAMRGLVRAMPNSRAVWRIKSERASGPSRASTARMAHLACQSVIPVVPIVRVVASVTFAPLPVPDSALVPAPVPVEVVETLPPAALAGVALAFGRGGAPDASASSSRSSSESNRPIALVLRASQAIFLVAITAFFCALSWSF